ncbi:acyl carrier protein [Streptomyces sp. NPDC096205]|uniref:acyl carrier protein n=1 Tax=Streptomyces sp. NPDC096205 TaxID=3366081 RepID=UPI0037FCBAE1
MDDVLFGRVREILSQKLNIPAEEIAPTSSFDEMELDSLAIVEFSLALEAEFGVPVSDSELLADPTMPGVVELLQHRGATV